MALSPQLAACATERIHEPGAIQAHGCLLVLDRALFVLQVSDNSAAFLGSAPHALLGTSIDSAMGAVNAALARRAIEAAAGSDRPRFAGRVELQTDRHADLCVHVQDGTVIVELESARDGVGVDFHALYSASRSFVSGLRGTRAVPELCGLAIAEMRKLTGFSRVLAYQFDPQTDDGQVIAEDLAAADVDSYIGLRFPAGDIPPQARALYQLNPVRLIADVDYQPARLVPQLDPRTQAPTDLSRSALRGVSPVHLQYMRNMRTASSMSVSIVIGGRLWGLISCHDQQARFVGFDQRAACEHIGQVLALQIEAALAQVETEHRLELRKQLVQLLAQVAQEERGFVAGLLSPPERLLGFMRATGVAILKDQGYQVRGIEVPETAVRRFVGWLAESARSGFHSDYLQRDYPHADSFGPEVSGVLAVSISELHDDFVIWFRPPIEQVVRWAGDPATGGPSVQVGSLDLPGPRRSFAEWRETVKGKSEPWLHVEVDIAEEFRAAILAIVLRQAEAKADLSMALQESNKELEAFSYSVSHDLRAPLRHIVGFADLLRQDRGSSLDANGLRYLKNIGEAAVFAGLLVDNLLSFSQMGRAALRPRRVSLAELIEKIAAEVSRETVPGAVQWNIGALPEVHADPVFLSLALRNLLANAVKYSRDRKPAVIKVEAQRDAVGVTTHVSDNGVGFDMKYVDKLFGIFQRLHRAEDFEGTGIGLANVRRIIERHGGRVWAQGEPERGATFSFFLPANPSQTETRKHADA